MYVTLKTCFAESGDRFVVYALACLKSNPHAWRVHKKRPLKKEEIMADFYQNEYERSRLEENMRLMGQLVSIMKD